jgi:hypothetical protein
MRDDERDEQQPMSKAERSRADYEQALVRTVVRKFTEDRDAITEKHQFNRLMAWYETGQLIARTLKQPGVQAIGSTEELAEGLGETPEWLEALRGMADYTPQEIWRLHEDWDCGDCRIMVEFINIHDDKTRALFLERALTGEFMDGHHFIDAVGEYECNHIDELLGPHRAEMRAQGLFPPNSNPGYLGPSADMA